MFFLWNEEKYRENATRRRKHSRKPMTKLNSENANPVTLIGLPRQQIISL
jgi:hypothetical protein